MTEESKKSGLYIDSDWKSEAAKEKERLAEQEQGGGQQPAADGGEQGGMFAELVNVLALQAAVALGGFQSPSGEQIPANPAAAKHHIDLLEVLERKTRGNLTEEEKRLLGGVLYELRMQYVQAMSGSPAQPPDQEQK